MPEAPEVEALARGLSEATRGAIISDFIVRSFAVMKTYEPSTEDFKGAEVIGWSRRGKYLRMETTQRHPRDTQRHPRDTQRHPREGGDPDLFMLVHLSRAGWIRVGPPDKGMSKMLAARLVVGDEAINITEAGTEKRLAIWCSRKSDDFAPFADLGVDVFSTDFTIEKLELLLKEHNHQVKGFLTDQKILSGIGNAYSDEILHHAKMSPYAMTAKLTEEEAVTLFHSIQTIEAAALENALSVPMEDLKNEKKRKMNVHAKAGESCPVCGDTIRSVHFASKTLEYCPTCQTGGKPLADRRMSKLLK